EASATTDTLGNYSFDGLLAGVHKVREVAPLGYLNAPALLDVNAVWETSGADFAHLPAILSASGPNDLFHLWREEDVLKLGKSAMPVDATYALPLASVADLRFNLGMAGAKVVVNYIGGSPIPLGGMVVDGA